jgi:hypothetical protein
MEERRPAQPAIEPPAQEQQRQREDRHEEDGLDQQRGQSLLGTVLTFRLLQEAFFHDVIVRSSYVISARRVSDFRPP